MSKAPKEKMKEAFQTTVAKLVQDMSLLMHGAGDVQPKEVNPATAMLVAALTTHYIEKLVEAAIDAHKMSRDNSTVRKDPLLPPPPFQKSLQPQVPPPPKSVPETSHSQKRRSRSNVQYWDEPLPGPRIAGRVTMPNKDDNDDEPHQDKWVGIAGVDLFYNQTRNAYVQGPAVLSTQSFIFPLCHDTYTYGRILEQQSFKKALEPVLVDRVVTETVQAEGQQHHAKARKKKKRKRQRESMGNTSDPEEDDGDVSADDEYEKEIPMWPGLDSLLPFDSER